MTNLINCGTCGYPLTPEERTTLIERDGVMVKPAPVQEIDWKDMYEKEKRRSEMWIAKYEKDIGPLEKAGPVAAQPEQEPVAVVGPWHDARLTLIPRYSHQTFEHNQPLYATPPQRTWVSLTDEDIKAVNAQVSQIPPIDYTTTTYAKAIEAKLKEKNNG